MMHNHSFGLIRPQQMHACYMYSLSGGNCIHEYPLNVHCPIHFNWNQKQWLNTHLNISAMMHDKENKVPCQARQAGLWLAWCILRSWFCKVGRCGFLVCCSPLWCWFPIAITLKKKLEVDLTLKSHLSYSLDSRWLSTSFCKGLVLHPLSSEGF